MIIVAGSALEYWQRFRLDRARYDFLEPFASNYFISCNLSPGKPHPSDAVLPSDDQVRRLLDVQLYGLTKPLHIGVASRTNRNNSEVKKCHLITNLASHGGFIRVDENVFVATPEYAYIQLSMALSFADALRLGYGLCGYYTLATSHIEEISEVQLVDALTSTKLIRAFAKQNHHLRGCKKIQRLLNYIQDGSASPMETSLALILCLPVRYGRFGFPFPKLNAAVDPSSRKLPEIHQSFFRCDLLWPEAKLVVEYDGEISHTGLDHIAHDASRRNDLNHLGFTVLSVTKRQVYQEDNLLLLATQIARHLGVWLWHKSSAFDWETRHKDLVDRLLYNIDKVNSIEV